MILTTCKNDFEHFEFVEKGEVISDDYKLLPVDLRDIKRLDDIIAFVDMDPRYEHVIIWLHTEFTFGSFNHSWMCNYAL